MNSRYVVNVNGSGSTLVKDRQTDEVFSAKALEHAFVDGVLSAQTNGVYATSLFGCQFASLGKSCLFCASPPFNGLRFSVPRLTKAMSEIVTALNTENCIIINGGSMVDPAATSYTLMRDYVLAARDFGFRRIHIELMPSPAFDAARIHQLVEQMQEDGVTSLQMNIEIWDRSIREIFMPYKGRIGLDIYMKWFDVLMGIYPRGKVMSVILGNLNSAEGLKHAVDALLIKGVVPSIEVVRRLDIDWREVNWPIELDSLQEHTIKLNERIANANICDPEDLEGCASCGGCNFIKDFMCKN